MAELTSIISKLSSYLAEHIDCGYVIGVGDGIPVAATREGELQTVGIGSAEELAPHEKQLDEVVTWRCGIEPIPTLPLEVTERSVVTCIVADRDDPDALMAGLGTLMRGAPILLLAAAPGSSRDALERMMASAGLEPTFTGHWNTTPLAIIERGGKRNVCSAPSDFRVTAVITSYNEEDIIAQTVLEAVQEGVDVRLVDNWSTDSTVARVESLDLGERVTIDRFPIAGPTGTFDWAEILRNTERIAREIGDGWVIRQDADEIRRSPWPGVTLRDALYHVQSQGYNAVDHTHLAFAPTSHEEFGPGDDPELRFRHLIFEARSIAHLSAWDARVGLVDIASSGGHEVMFPGRRVYPFKFQLQHYPIRSQAHGERKLFMDRKPRRNHDEYVAGWHTHYDDAKPGNTFIFSSDSLIDFDDDFSARYLVQRLTGIGVQPSKLVRLSSSASGIDAAGSPKPRSGRCQ